MITGKTHRRRNLRCSPGAMRGCQSGLLAQIRLGGRLDQWFASSEVYRRNHEMQPVLKLYNNQGPTTARLLGRLINANITTYPSEVYRRSHEMQPVLDLYDNKGPATKPDSSAVRPAYKCKYTTYPRASLYGQRNSNQCDKRKIK